MDLFHVISFDGKNCHIPYIFWSITLGEICWLQWYETIGHCVKSSLIKSFIGSVFSFIRTKYGKILFSVRIRENTDHKKLQIRMLFTVYLSNLPFFAEFINWFLEKLAILWYVFAKSPSLRFQYVIEKHANVLIPIYLTVTGFEPTTTYFLNKQPTIYRVWLNGWAFVDELSGCGFKSRCCPFIFRYRACSGQGVHWHSSNYRV